MLLFVSEYSCVFIDVRIIGGFLLFFSGLSANASKCGELYMYSGVCDWYRSGLFVAYGGCIVSLTVETAAHPAANIKVRESRGRIAAFVGYLFRVFSPKDYYYECCYCASAIIPRCCPFLFG